jgi:hypothetical protein
VTRRRTIRRIDRVATHTGGFAQKRGIATTGEADATAGDLNDGRPVVGPVGREPVPCGGAILAQAMYVHKGRAGAALTASDLERAGNPGIAMERP